MRFATLLLLTTMLTGPDVARDPQADALLQRVEARLRPHVTLTADLILTDVGKDGKQSSQHGVLKLKRPNLVRLEIEGNTVFVSDGKVLWCYYPKKHEYVKVTPDPPARVVLLPIGSLFFHIGPDPAEAFFAESISKLVEPSATIQVGRRERINGTEYQTVEISREEPDDVIISLFYSLRQRLKLLIGADDIIYGYRSEVRTRGGRWQQELWLRNVTLDADLADTEFLYEPTADAKRLADPAASLIAVGRKAPNFNLPVLASRDRLTLSDALKGKKAVIVVFWRIESERCKATLSHLQRIHSELKDSDLGIVAINRENSQRQVTRFVREQKLPFTVVMGGKPFSSTSFLVFSYTHDRKDYVVFKDYGVLMLPTVYVIGSDGSVLWRASEFEEQDLRRALEEAGLR